MAVLLAALTIFAFVTPNVHAELPGALVALLTLVALMAIALAIRDTRRRGEERPHPQSAAAEPPRNLPAVAAPELMTRHEALDLLLTCSMNGGRRVAALHERVMNLLQNGVLVTILLALAGLAAPAQARADQHVLARQILGDDVGLRNRAWTAVTKIPPSDAGPELRAALIAALEREAAVHTRRYEAGRRGEALDDLRDPHFIDRLSPVVGELRDAQAIPALAAALSRGSPEGAGRFWRPGGAAGARRRDGAGRVAQRGLRGTSQMPD